MKPTAGFFESVINSVTEHIVIIDDSGIIQSVNTAWVNFGLANGSRNVTDKNWSGVNYLDVCDASALAGEADAAAVIEGTNRVIDGEDEVFYHEYPCHSETEKRWFMMRITPLDWSGPSRYVISHQNITERKLAEERVRALSRQDGLTGLPNRRRFDEFLESEWRRAQRGSSPVSLMILDVDHFKLYNDHYGHMAGDDCLKQVAAALGEAGRRPADLAARYGGEEFALIMGGTSAEPAHDLAQRVLRSIAALEVPHEASPDSAYVSVSIGVATLVPDAGADPGVLIVSADEALYAAKKGGRNRVAVHAP